MNPYCIQNNLDRIAGNDRNENRLKYGTLLVEVLNEKQWDRLLKTAVLRSYPIKFDRYAALKCCWGVVRTDFFDDISNDEMSLFLRPVCFQGIPTLEVGKCKGKVVPLLFLTEHHAMMAYWGMEI
jgi:hypothetical protein